MNTTEIMNNNAALLVLAALLFVVVAFRLLRWGFKMRHDDEVTTEEVVVSKNGTKHK